MTVRAKTFTIIGVTLGGVIAVLYVVLSLTLMDGCTRLEEREVREDVARVTQTLQGDLNTLNETNGDWAPWDDTYAFVAGGSPDYVKANLDGSTFANLRLNFILFYDQAGRLVMGKGVEPRAQRPLPIPRSLAHLSAHSPLLRHVHPTGSRSGILLLPEGCMEVSSRPIVKSDYSGPIRGTLIMARFLDAVELARLRRATCLRIWAFRLNDPSFRSRRASLSQSLLDGKVLVEPLGPDYVEGKAIVRDVLGRPALLFCVGQPRDIYQQGRRSTRSVLLALLTVGVIASAASLALADRLVVARLARLSLRVAAIGKSGDLSARVPTEGSDELSALAKELNRTLDALQASHRQLEERERAYRHLFQEAALQRERARTLAVRLADAEETERRRLACELHDRVGQNLTALGINLNLVRSQMAEGYSPAVAERVDDSLALVDETTERIRDVMADLRPSVLDDYGLVAALEGHAGRLTQRTGLTVVVENPDALDRLPAPVETGLFRIAQEALANVVRHSQARRATITLERDGSMLRFTVADDGIGYRPKEGPGDGAREGWGLLIMSERAEAVGGRLRIYPGATRGTCVEVEVEVPHEHDHCDRG